MAASGDPATTEALAKILSELNEMKLRNAQLEQKLDNLHGITAIPSPSSHARKMSSSGLSPMVRPLESAGGSFSTMYGSSPPAQPLGPPSHPLRTSATATSSASTTSSAAGVLPQTNNPTPHGTPDLDGVARRGSLDAHAQTYSSHVILSTYPGQAGIRPLPLRWYAQDPHERGPVIASRHPKSIKIRNAIGAYGGTYCVYRALSIAVGKLNPMHRPDFTNTEPPFEIPANPSWYTPGKIVSIDPWGHLAPQVFRAEFEDGRDIRPTIAMTRAHIKMPEIDEAFRLGRIPLDGKIVSKSERLPGVPLDADPGIEVSCSKAAIEPCWYLPGIAEKLGVAEGPLRRALFEETGGMYPELLTRHDLRVFLPPIPGATVYIFGPPQYLHDTNKEITVRVHDQCGGSDVFGSDICTCESSA
jgi:GTP cyclohydrolase II